MLATEATALIRGRASAEAAAATAATTFEQGGLGAGLPTVEIKRGDLEAGIGVLAAFVSAGLAASNGEARRHIEGGGLRVNDAPVSDVRARISGSDVTQEGVIKLSLGRKRHVLLKPI